MKDAILPTAAFHHQIQAPGRAAEHVPDVAGCEHHAFSFARGSGGVDNRYGIRFRDLKSVQSDIAWAGENLIEKKLRRRFWPMLRDRVPQRHIAATDQARSAILHHGYEF